MAQADTTDGTTGSTGPWNGSAPWNGRRPRPRSRWRDGRTWRRGSLTATLAVAVALVMAFHTSVPDSVGNIGSLVETFLPWFGLAVPLLLVVGLLRRSALTLVAVVVPTLVWLDLFGGLVTGKSAPGGNLTVLTHNVDAANPDPAATTRHVLAAHAGIVALEELTGRALPVYERGLAGAYPYHAVEGTVGLWSRYPIRDTQPVDIKLGWVRAMRTTVATPYGDVAVYVAHMPSVRVHLKGGFTAGQRDVSAAALGEAIASEPLHDVILLGDLNGTMNDRSLAPLTSQLRSAQGAAGDGFGFSWPARFPMARIDQIMVKGVVPTTSWVLPDSGSDHRPVAATVEVGP
ncbi:endonuclease/exonuclease/phosphatase family protein [Streptomyces sp. RB6PN25]|uniref:Endonuclease/exonuclease/phosphatase family protein n=1 Tax=Streptomyces humicola TaxID=2953240 RepID=A0ABT1Q469_9ACTN|nr:endonuclease/exonuclease/phosphatase family protein [Streptomyces humicola]MCQ4084692.1 endonuclease/exonuclease/phosphatase family protein [Streptomyces humicola]